MNMVKQILVVIIWALCWNLVQQQQQEQQQQQQQKKKKITNNPQAKTYTQQEQTSNKKFGKTVFKRKSRRLLHKLLLFRYIDKLEPVKSHYFKKFCFNTIIKCMFKVFKF